MVYGFKPGPVVKLSLKDEVFLSAFAFFYAGILVANIPDTFKLVGCGIVTVFLAIACSDSKQ